MFEPADGLFGTLVTEQWIVDELASHYGTRISNLRFTRIGETEGSFSRVCLMESDGGGGLPKKLILKIPTCLTYLENRKRRGWTGGDFSHVKNLLTTYHNKETLFYEHAQGVTGVPRVFLSQPLADADDRGIICMEYLEGARTRAVYESISVDEMKSILDLYTGIQKGCTTIPANARQRLDGNVFELLASTTLSLDTLMQRLSRMACWAPELSTVLSDLMEALPKFLDHSLITRLHSECQFGPLFVHGDLYSSNILWLNAEVKKIIDYQMVHFGNPVEDLIRLFATGLAAEDRKTYTDELLGHYRTRITAILPELEGPVTRHSLSTWYREAFPMAGLWAIVSIHASFESATSRKPPDERKLKAVLEKIRGVATDILEVVG